jgi:hypothetical protein
MSKSTHNRRILTCALTKPETAKRAALVFDEIVLFSPKCEYPREHLGDFLYAALNHDFKDLWEAVLPRFSEICRDNGRSLVPVYNSKELMSEHFPDGQEVAYQAAIECIPTVAEEHLEWQQVCEFRRDREAWGKYRKLRLWLSDGLQAKSVDQAVDVISTKIADYEWAIRKHGLKTVTGVVSLLGNPKSLGKAAAGAGVAAALGGPIWAAVSAGLMLTSEIAVHLANRMIEVRDLKMGENSEIALLYEAGKGMK